MGGDQRTWRSANPESRIFRDFFYSGFGTIFSGFGIRDFGVPKFRDSGRFFRDPGFGTLVSRIRDTGFGMLV